MRGDLHRHLLGSIPVRCIKALLEASSEQPLESRLTEPQRSFLESTEEGEALLSKLEAPAATLNPTFFKNFTSLTGFLQCYLATSCLINSPSSFRLLVEEVVAATQEERLDYVELTVSPSLYTDRGIPFEALAEVLKEVKESAEGNVQWLLDPIRNRGAEHSLELLKRCLKEAPSVFAGVSLAGDETSAPLPQFTRYFEIARSEGLGTTCHIGESLQSSELTHAMTLPLDRIGHGIAAASEEEILNALVDRGVVFEVCLSSNLRTGVVPDISAHPLTLLLKNGAKVSLATDDPFFFQTTIENEFELAKAHGLSPKELTQLEANTAQAAFAL